MNIVIIDDEADARTYLKVLLESFHPNLNILGEAENVANGIALLKDTAPDLIFLDVEMPDGTGFDLLKAVGERSFYVIFCTAYDKYALEAIKLSALDYLLKPIDPEDLAAAIEKANSNHQVHTSQIQTLVNNFQQASFEEKKIILKDKSNFYIVAIKDIIRCQGEGSYTTFYLKDGEAVTVSKNLKTYQKILDEQLFFRVHNSHLINLNCVKRISRQDGGTVILSNQSEVPISKHRKETLYQKLGLL